MDIFDSATPKMRRKHNRKKAISVILQLQATSEIVTPTELIFDNLGQFKKEHAISGEPSSEPAPTLYMVRALVVPLILDGAPSASLRSCWSSLKVSMALPPTDVPVVGI
jgi:hypothetical protein